MASMTTDAEAPAEQAKGGKKKPIVMIVPVLVIALAAGWFFFLRGGDEAAAEAPAEPEHQPGVVLVLEPITINLAGGHFLKLGLALQQDAATAGGHGEPDGSQALDLAISTFSGKSLDELSTQEGRAAAKAELLAEIVEAYHHEYYDLYFTEFIMQ